MVGAARSGVELDVGDRDPPEHIVHTDYRARGHGSRITSIWILAWIREIRLSSPGSEEVPVADIFREVEMRNHNRFKDP